jgi:hypothetical protein
LYCGCVLSHRSCMDTHTHTHTHTHRYKPLYPTPKDAKNVLFLAVDDMRPSLEPYNFTIGHSPNINSLAQSGLLFKFAYVQYAFCSPSRNSFMVSVDPP